MTGKSLGMCQIPRDAPRPGDSGSRYPGAFTIPRSVGLGLPQRWLRAQNNAPGGVRAALWNGEEKCKFWEK